MQEFIQLILENQPFLVKSILRYSQENQYSKYTSTLEEAWVLSITGLSKAMTDLLACNTQLPEIPVDFDFSLSPAAAFGVTEARLHRKRGISLDMFLGLMKYFRRSYLDLVKENVADAGRQLRYSEWLNRFFDCNEVAFCSEWSALIHDSEVIELQEANRVLTNEKNKYVTIFESIPTPVILLDVENRCKNINYAAHQFLVDNPQAPGYSYFKGDEETRDFCDVLPWLKEEFQEYLKGDCEEATSEKEFSSPSLGRRNLIIRFHRMLDVSKKFEGTVIIFTDITKRKQVEEQLRFVSFHDSLTGLYNRAYFEQEIICIYSEKDGPLGMVSCDVDGLKLVNDTLGHHAGDTLLKTVAGILTDCFDSSQPFARTGGDEFAALLPGCSEESTRAAYKRILQRVEEHNRDNPNIPVSLSVGWSWKASSTEAAVDALVREADRRMYRNKQESRIRYTALFRQCFEQFGHGLFQKGV